MMNSKLKLEVHPLISGLLPFIFYLITMNPSVDFIDSGELTAVAYTLGVAHPTGYPLFTIISHIFIALPIPLRVIQKANLFSAVVSSLSLYFFAKFLILVSDQRSKHAEFFAFVSTLIFGFTQFFWEQAITFEVYSFQMLFISLVLFSIFKFERTGETNYLLLFSFLLGLSFTNHLTIIFLIPSLIYIFISDFVKKVKTKVLIFMFFFFLVGLSPFFYLPIRSASGVVLNWGDPSNFENFLNHITGKQYRVWAFSSFEVMIRQLSYFFSKFSENFGYLALLFAFIGLWKTFKLNKKIFYFTTFSFLTCILISSNYDIHDINAYFLTAIAMTSIWIFYGLTHLPRKMPDSLAIALGILCVLISLPVNFTKVDKSKNYLPEVYTLHILKNAEPNAIIISYQWDYFVSPSLYFQLVENIRKDIIVIDKELLRRSWYIKQLQRNYPWLIERSKSEVEAFLTELYKFEHDLPYNPIEIEKRFVNMINSFVDKNIGDRPIYLGIEIEPEFGAKYVRVPEGFMFRLHLDSEYKNYEYVPIDVSKRCFDSYSKNLVNLIAKMIVNRGIYEFRFGKIEKAKFYFEEALRVNSEAVEAKLWLERLRNTR